MISHWRKHTLRVSFYQIRMIIIVTLNNIQTLPLALTLALRNPLSRKTPLLSYQEESFIRTAAFPSSLPVRFSQATDATCLHCLSQEEAMHFLQLQIKIPGSLPVVEAIKMASSLQPALFLTWKTNVGTRM